MSRLTLVSVPFHLGVRAVGMGEGPLALLDDGAVPARLRTAGHQVEITEISDPSAENEIARVFEINRELAAVLSGVRTRGQQPLIVAGNCNVCLGAIGGIAGERVGIVWLDAHPDFHTPETTDSGFLDGMGLAIATGGCWRALATSIPGFRSVEQRNAILVGVRDVDPGERERLDSGEVSVIEGGGGPGRLPIGDLAGALDDIARRVDAIYLHLDLDSIDPSLGPANEYAVDGGLGLDDVRATVSAVAERVPIRATSFTAYNPNLDPDREFLATAVDAIGVAVEASLAASG